MSPQYQSAHMGWTGSQHNVLCIVICTCIACIQGTTLYPESCRRLSFSQFQPWILIPLTCTQLVLLSISNVQVAVLCLPRFWAPQSHPRPLSPPALSPCCSLFLPCSRSLSVSLPYSPLRQAVRRLGRAAAKWECLRALPYMPHTKNTTLSNQ